MDSMNTLSVIVPVYNEQDTVGDLLHLVASTDVPFHKELVIVDDGSKDNSPQIIKQFIERANYPKTSFVFEQKENGGKGSALKHGMHKATGDIMIVQDADLEYDPADYMRLVRPIIDGKTKVVYGSRLRGKNNQAGHWTFLLGGMAVTAATNLLFLKSLTDEPTCYKVFHKDLKPLLTNAESNTFAWEPEVTAKIFRSGHKIHEVPISYNPRTDLEGKKIRMKDGVEAISTLLKWRFKNF